MREVKENITPTISVISANYNNGEFLDGFFFWLEKSTVNPNEVIIVDDASTDSSVHKLKSYKGHLNLQCFPFDENSGLSAALNYAIEKSTGEYLLRIDPDDLIHPERIDKQLNFLKENKDIDLVGSNAWYFHQSPHKPFFKSNLPLQPGSIVRSIENGDIPILHSCMMGKREVFINNHFKESKYPLEDYLFLCDLVKSNVRMANLPDKLTLVRIHSKSASSILHLRRTKELFEIRERYFGHKSSPIRIFLNYIHTKLYRKFLMSESIIKWFWLILAGAVRPKKIFSRLLK